METINKMEELNTLVNENKRVIIKFGAEWCAPCKMLETTLISMEKEYPDIKFAHIDVEECDNYIVEKYEIMTVPTLIMFESGEITHRETGNIQKATLISKLSL